ncbi:MAG: amidase, partial [Bacteroidota bacterium]
GTKRVLTVGKELEIRRWLSRSHLYSSAFIVEKEGIHHGVPQQFTLHGAGWGHGVGLCQIGAAVMASRGYSHTEILRHYFKNSTINRHYD